MAHDVFISHANADSTIAQAVCARLEEQGIRCWIAPRDIHPGADWRSNIVKGIQEARALVLVFSASSNASQEVPREIAQATKHGLSIVTFRIEDVVPSGSLDYDLSTVHWLDAMTPPLEANIQRLGDALRLILDTPRTATISEGPGWKKWLGGIAVMAIAFACTGLALDHGGLGNLFPTYRGAAFFGLLLAVLVLPHWAERWIVAVVSIPVYHGAVRLAMKLPGGWYRFVPSAVLGAVVMNLAVALFDKRLLRADAGRRRDRRRQPAPATSDLEAAVEDRHDSEHCGRFRTAVYPSEPDSCEALGTGRIGSLARREAQ